MTIESKENGRSERRIVTVGSFDGVHRGHIQVLDALKEAGELRGLRPTAVTFDRHPLNVVAPDRAPLLLQDIDVRDNELRNAGVEVIRVPFTESISKLSAREWMKRLRNDYNAAALLTGYDNKFGCDGRHLSQSDYERIGQAIGLEVLQAPELPGVSSSIIRKILQQGDVERASSMLGRRFRIEGTVEHGRQLGRTIGFPTANLGISPGFQLPSAGVYAALVNGKPAVVNIGRNPTLGPGNPITVEAHLIGFEGDLYDQRMGVEFVGKIRGEEIFPDLQALRTRIEQDVAQARSMLEDTSRELSGNK